MGLFGNILGAIGNFIGDIFGGGRGGGGDNEVDTFALDRAYEEFKTKLKMEKNKWEGMRDEILPFAESADDRYDALVESNFTQVPAVELYDGIYADRVTETYEAGRDAFTELEIKADQAYDKAKAEAEFAASFTGHGVADPFAVEELIGEIETVSQQNNEDMAPTSTEIQTFLREPTSEIKAAEIWDAKFVKAAVEHIPPHYPGVKYTTGDPMSEVMRAYRMYEETNAYQLIGFGSQEAINAMYEAYMEGQDPYAYIDRIMNLIAGDAEDGSDYNEFSDVIVPDADGFGGSFLF